MSLIAPDEDAAQKGQTIGEAAAEANLNAASLVDAVMPSLSFPHVAPPDTTFFPTDSSAMPLTTTELRDHMIALYNTSESIRKYCRSNGIARYVLFVKKHVLFHS